MRGPSPKSERLNGSSPGWSWNPQPPANPGWVERYYEFLNKPRRSELRLDEAKTLKRQNLPSSLFKYANFESTVDKASAEQLEQDVEGQPWTLVNLKNQVISLRPPGTFNDPFDSSLSFGLTDLVNDAIAKTKSQQQDIQESDTERSPLPQPNNNIEWLLQEHFRKAPEEFGDYETNKRVLESVLDAQNKKAVSDFVNGMRNALRISCFSERRDLILMWSHYGQHHRGICMEYESRSLLTPTGNGFLHPVSYNPTRFQAIEYFRSYPDSNPLMLTIAACHKSPAWSYEQEWRFIDITFAETLQIRPKRIFLGACIDLRRREEVIAIAREQHIPVLQASR